jgi:hypothetical protein
LGAILANGFIRSIHQKDTDNLSWSTKDSIAALGPIAERMQEIPPSILSARFEELTQRLKNPAASIFGAPQRTRDIRNSADFIELVGRAMKNERHDRDKLYQNFLRDLHAATGGSRSGDTRRNAPHHVTSRSAKESKS